MKIIKGKRRILRKIRSKASSFGIQLLPGDRKIDLLSQKHSGERCVIIGMGPSLKVADLNYFKNWATFACNKIYLSFDETDWRPTYYSIIDHLVARNNLETIKNADFSKTISIYSESMKQYFGVSEKNFYYYLKGSLQDKVEADTFVSRKKLSEGILGEGFTVVIDQIQLAILMGFEEIYLVGLDYSFIVGEKSGEMSPSGEVLLAGEERNHFHPDYRKPGETWTVPRLAEQLIAFENLKKIAAKRGVKLLNASRTSKLPVIDKVDFDSVFTPPRLR